MPQALTAQQIARKVGLSNATVSRVLNNSQTVSPATRDRVLTAVRESGRVPRIMGRRSKRAKEAPATPTPGLIQILMVSRFPIDKIKESDAGRGSEVDGMEPEKFFSSPARLATSFSRHIVDGILDEFGRLELRAVLQVVRNLASANLVAEINREANGGLFLLGIYDKDVDKFLPKCRCPIVSLMTWDHQGWPDYVGIDNYSGIGLSFDHLRQLGTRGSGTWPVNWSSARLSRGLAAYKTHVADAGMPYRPDWVVEGSCKLDAMEAGVEKVLSSPDRPTAMMCCFDGAAVSVKRAADRLGLQIPQRPERRRV